jgi:hypothetical protein
MNFSYPIALNSPLSESTVTNDVENPLIDVFVNAPKIGFFDPRTGLGIHIYGVEARMHSRSTYSYALLGLFPVELSFTPFVLGKILGNMSLGVYARGGWYTHLMFDEDTMSETSDYTIQKGSFYGSAGARLSFSSAAFGRTSRDQDSRYALAVSFFAEYATTQYFQFGFTVDNLIMLITPLFATL